MNGISPAIASGDAGIGTSEIPLQGKLNLCPKEMKKSFPVKQKMSD
jgi:hypothetical protein